MQVGRSRNREDAAAVGIGIWELGEGKLGISTTLGARRSNPLGSVVDASGSDPHYINQRNTYWGSEIIASAAWRKRGYLFMLIWLWRKSWREI